MTRPNPQPPGVVARTAWLMLGAAIGLAAALIAVTVAAALTDVVRVPQGLAVVVCLLPVPLLGLVPGVRELEHTAARSMLDRTLELVAPQDRRDRGRLIGWVAVHLVAGLVSGFLLLGLIPGAVTVAVSTLGGATEVLERVGVPVVNTAGGRTLVVGACVLVTAACLATVGLLGLAVRRLVRVFLGPTWRDRLQVAETRLAAEVEQTRLARELHDGIGHALTLISVQAVAGRRMLGRDPAVVETALTAIETTARSALTELDTMLGALRDDAAERSPEPDLDQLDRLVALHRDTGLDLTAETGPVDGLPALVSRSAYRLVAEALTNAHRHAGPGPTRLTVHRDAAGVRIEVSNPRPHGAVGRVDAEGRRGLLGMAERVRLFGGTLDSGPEDDRWVVRAVLPTGDGPA